MRKAFSLIEVLISIVLFSVILLFLYKALDITRQSNTFYEKKLNTLSIKNRIKTIIYEDIAQSKEIEILFDKEGQSLIKLETSNLYHNSFNKYVTYIISSENNLIRIESANKFNEKEVLDSFFQNTYVDVLLRNIEKFNISQTKDNKNIYSFFIKDKSKKVFFFNALKL